MKNNTKKFARRGVALLLALTMCFSMVMGAGASTTYKLCTQEEHSHGPECYQYYVLKDPNDVEREAHTHRFVCAPSEGESSCYATSEMPTCGIESHEHSLETCSYEIAYTCETEWDKEPVYESPEELSEGEPVLVEEGIRHEHTGDCSHNIIYTCETKEHTHTDECYQGELTCATLTEAHTHSFACYELVEYNPENPDARIGDVSSYETKSWDADLATLDWSHTKYKELNCNKEVHTHNQYCITESVTREKVQNIINTDSNATIDLNGQTVAVDKTIEVGNGKTVTFTGGGTLQAAASGLANVIKVVTGGTLTLKDVTVDGNNTARGVLVDGGKLNLEKGGTITNGKASNATNGTFGTGSKAYEAGGGGVLVDNRGTFNMTGGTVSNNVSQDKEGGGIYIRGNSTGTISAGLIENNTTNTTNDLGGGGIYVNNDATLYLTNLIVTENTANGLGGGYAACIHGKTTIFGGDQGAAIYGNHASTDKSGNKVPTASLKDVTNSDGWYNQCVVDQSGGKSFWNQDETFKSQAQDIFAATVSQVSGTPGSVVSNDMLGGVNAGWVGNTIVHKPGCPVLETAGRLINPNDKPNGTGNGYSDGPASRVCTCRESGSTTVSKPIDRASGVIYSGGLLGLTASPTEAALTELAKILSHAQELHASGEDGYVIVTGNHSAMHGGGIANNGNVIIGKKPVNLDGGIVDSKPAEITVNKAWDSDHESLTNGHEISVTLEGNGYTETHTVSTNSGAQTFTIPRETLSGFSESSKTFDFTLTETDTNPLSADGTSACPNPSKTVRVTVDHTTADSVTVGETTYTRHSYTVKSITIDGVSAASATFTNTYTRHRGSLTVSKTVADNTALDLAEDAYSFTITGDSLMNDTKRGYAVTEGATLQDNGATLTLTVPVSELNGSATISGLPTGTYKVQEVGTENGDTVLGNGWELKVTGNNASASVTQGSSNTVPVTNTYDYQYSGLSFQKTVNFQGQDSERQDDFAAKTFTFQIAQGSDCVTVMSPDKVQNATVAEDGKTATVEVKGDGEMVTVTGLPVGTYTVTELNAQDEAEAKDYTLTVTGEKDYSVVYGTANPVEITNDYGYNRGSLSIKKVVDGTADKKLTDAKEFTFTVRANKEYVNGEYDLTVTPDQAPETPEAPDVTPGPGTVKFTNGVSEPITIVGPGSIQIDNLPVGSYTVAEADASLSGYNWSVSGNNAAVVLEKDTVKDVTVTNNYWVPNIPVTQNLTVNKVWVGDEGVQRPTSVRVQLMADGAPDGEPVTLSAANGWSHTWLGKAAGVKLTVVELDVPQGYTATTVPSGNTVVLTNTYDPAPTPTPTPTPAPSPTPEPDEEIPDDDVPLGPGPGDPEDPDDPDDPDEELPDPDVPLGPADPEDPDDPDEELPDPDIPLAPAEPEEEEIPDDDVPLASTPKTGDNRNLWYLLTCLSAAGLVLLAATGRKKQGQSK